MTFFSCIILLFRTCKENFHWTLDDWRDFLDDIQLTRSQDREHFFGFMTFKKEDNKIVIPRCDAIYCNL